MKNLIRKILKESDWGWADEQYIPLIEYIDYIGTEVFDNFLDYLPDVTVRLSESYMRRNKTRARFFGELHKTGKIVKYEMFSDDRTSDVMDNVWVEWDEYDPNQFGTYMYNPRDLEVKI
jgi:hypothetical protein